MEGRKKGVSSLFQNCGGGEYREKGEENGVGSLCNGGERRRV